jgi:hypothetical protein
MKKLSFFCTAAAMIFVLLSSCLAKEPSIDNKGKWGISLSVSGLSNLGIGLYQGGIGVKHWRTNSFAWKAIVGFGVSNTVYPAYYIGYTDAKTKESKFSINPGLEFHFLKDTKFSPYFYTGFDVSTTSTTYDYSIYIADPTQSIRQKHISNTSLGLDGALGLEYFFNSHLSLSAEYQINASYQFHREKFTVISNSTATYPITNDYDNFNFGTKTSSLILTIYF